MKKILLGGLIVVLVFVATAGYLVLTFDPNVWRNRIAHTMAELFQRDVRLDGRMTLSVWPDFAISAENFAIGNPAGASRKDMIVAGKAAFSLSVLPLLHRQLVVEKILLSNADMLIEPVNDGRLNIQFDKTQKPPSDKDHAPAVISGNTQQKPEFLLAAKDIELKDIVVGYRDAEGLKPQKLMIRTLRLSADTDQPITAKGQVVWQDHTVDLVLGTTSLSRIMRGDDKIPVNLSLNAQGNIVHLAGNVTHDQKNSFGVDGNIGLNVPHLAAFSDLMGGPLLPDAGVAEFDALLHYGGQSLALSNIKTSIGKSVLQGNLAFNLAGVRPGIKGNLDADVIDLSPFMIVKDDHPVAPAGKPPATPSTSASIPFDALKAVDLVLDLNVHRLDGLVPGLGPVTTHLVLDNGVLTLNPVDIHTDNGVAKGAISVTSTGVMDTHMVLDHIPYGKWLEISGISGVVDGMMRSDIVLHGTGSNLDTLQRNMQGKMMIDIGGGKIDTRQFNAGWFTALRSSLPIPIDAVFMVIRCGYGVINFVPGRVETDGFLLDTDQLTLYTIGQIETAKAPPEEILGAPVDMRMRARASKLLGSEIAAPVTIGGTVQKLSVHLDKNAAMRGIADRLLGTRIGGGMVVPVVSQAVPAGQNACRLAMENSVANRPASSGPSTTEPVINTAPVVDKARDKLKNLFDKLQK